MDAIAFPFAMMGFMFGMLACTQLGALSKRISKLEQRLKDAGLDLPEETA